MSDIYKVELFEENDFYRKECVDCGRTFWTLDSERITCGDTPCDEYSFIENPPISKDYTRSEMEEEFLSFFEERGHEVISRYPVEARWRDDIYLTIASIADFQPWVTSGEAPPPANPLVVSQSSIRLNDIDNVGRSGRHMTLFFMGGHHAFNRPGEEVYWTDETVRNCHDFLTERLGIKPSEITYVEDFWSGGGNAGEDFEVNVKGLELSTLVFMQYGLENGEKYELPLKVVDTGYGIERMVWASQGTPNSYEAVFGPVVSKLKDLAGITPPPEDVLKKHSKMAGLMDIETGRDLGMLREEVSEATGLSVDRLSELMEPLESVYAIADHLRCLAFMFGDGITPSNEGGGYLSRLVLRRALRLMRDLEMDESLMDLMEIELEHLSDDFPDIYDKKDHILEVIDLEQDRYKETISQGERLVSRIASSLKKENEKKFPQDKLMELYDSQGLPPEIVDDVLEKEDIEVDVPDDFYKRVADLHSEAESVGDEDSQELDKFEGVEKAEDTKLLYYNNPYQKNFESEIVWKKDNYLALRETAFYPEGGGQPADEGVLKLNGEEIKVLNVRKKEGTVIHEVERDLFEEGQKVQGEINWSIRGKYMRHHTATHILLGALREVLGEHVWQHGVKKGKNSSRLDISHHKRISEEKLREIERLANKVVFQNREVKSLWMDRSEAEKKYGHSLYQGGVVPGERIRIIDIEDWNAQACAGTHCTRTGEVGLIKVVGRERIQDGVERLIFASGEAVLENIQEREKKVKKASEILRTETENIDKATQKLFDQWKESEKEIEELKGRLAEYQAGNLVEEAEELDGYRLVAEELETGNTDELIQTGEDLVEDDSRMVVILGAADESANLIIMAGKELIEKGIDCGKAVSEASKELGGGGGGRAKMGQGGGPKKDKLKDAINTAKKEIKEQIGS